MLDYEWGNPSMIMLSGDESVQESDHNRQIFYPYASAAAASQGFSEATSFVGNNNPNGHFTTTTNHHHHHHQQPQHHDHIFHHNPHGQVPSNNTHLSSLYDPRAYDASASYSAAGQHVVPHQASLLSLEPAGSAGFMVVPKSEPVVGGLEFGTNTSSFSRIGLNLGGRTYFSSSEDDFVNRIYRRSRAIEAGSVNSPRCQAEGCNADLTHAKHYHRRHKVCEFHSKAATVIAAGLTQRFCQQCSRFHQLSEFDSGKRSCRKRLADHNRRRRKSQQAANQELANKSQLDNARNSSSDNLARSPSDSGPHSSSSITVALSPPRISADCFRQRSLYQATTTTTTTTPSSSTSTGSLFFSKG